MGTVIEISSLDGVYVIDINEIKCFSKRNQLERNCYKKNWSKQLYYLKEDKLKILYTEADEWYS